MMSPEEELEIGNKVCEALIKFYQQGCEQLEKANAALEAEQATLKQELQKLQTEFPP